MAEEKKKTTTKKVVKKEEDKKETKKKTTPKTTTTKKETKVKVVKEEVAKKTPTKKVTKKVEKEEPKKQPTKEELLDRTMIFDGAQKKNLKEVVENLEKENVVLKDKVIKRSKVKKVLIIILVLAMLGFMIFAGVVLGKELYQYYKQSEEVETLNSNLYDKVNVYRDEIKDKTVAKKDEDEKDSVLQQITLTEFEKKVLDKENMTILISSSTCLYCMQFEPTVEEVLKEQEKTIYVIEINSMKEKEINRFREYYPFTITPTIFTIKDGSIIAEQEGITSKDKLTEWVTKNMQ